MVDSAAADRDEDMTAPSRDEGVHAGFLEHIGFEGLLQTNTLLQLARGVRKVRDDGALDANRVREHLHADGALMSKCGLIAEGRGYRLVILQGGEEIPVARIAASLKRVEV